LYHEEEAEHRLLAQFNRVVDVEDSEQGS
jgi:hypothetical protein